MRKERFKTQILTNLFQNFFVLAFALSNADAQVENQDIKEFNSLYSFENISIDWKGDPHVQMLLNDGVNNLNERKLAEAVSSFEEILSINPNFPTALYYRGVCYRLQNNFIKAKSDFAKLIELRDNLPQAYLEMSKVKVSVGFNNEAVQFLTTCIEKFPNYVSAYYLMGNNYLITREIEKAKSFFEICQRISPAFLPAKVKLGLIEMNIKKDPQAGIKFFSEVIQEDSLQKEALWYRATLTSRTDPKKSVQDLNVLVRHSGANFFFLLQRGLVRVDLNDFDGAWSDFRMITNIPIKDRVNVSAAASRFISIQNARNYLSRFIYGLNEKDRYTLKKSFCLIVAGKNQEAIKTLKKAEVKKSAFWQYLSGIANENIGLYKEAQEYYISALRFDNDIFDVHQKRGVYLLETNDLEHAIKHFDEMIRISPDDKSGYALRSVAKYKLKDYVFSIKDASKVLKIDSSDCDVRRVLGFAYLATDKILPAFETLFPCRDLEIYNLDLLKFHKSVTTLLNAGDTAKVFFYLTKMTDFRPLYEAGTRLKIDILNAQKKWNELQYFLRERVQRFATMNSQEYKIYINEELIRVENILKQLSGGSMKEKG